MVTPSRVVPAGAAAVVFGGAHARRSVAAHAAARGAPVTPGEVLVVDGAGAIYPLTALRVFY